MKAVDAGKGIMADEYAKHIGKDDGWTGAPRESIWIEQERSFRIHEEKRCDLKIMIRLKEGQVLPQISKESTRTSYGTQVRVPGMRLYRVKRRRRREAYLSEKKEWVVWAKPGDPAPARRIPKWRPICCENYRKQCGCFMCGRCNQNPDQPVCKGCHTPHMLYECPNNLV